MGSDSPGLQDWAVKCAFAAHICAAEGGSLLRIGVT